MKIGIVSSYFYPCYGGITEHVYFQYRELKRRGHDVRVITPFDGSAMLDHPEDLIRLGRPVPLIVNGSIAHVPVVRQLSRKVDAIVEKEHFDLLHLHQPLFCVLGLAFLRNVRARRLQSRHGPAVVGTFHASGGSSEQFLINRLKFYFGKFHEDIHHRIAVSAASRETVMNVLPGHYDIIPNGVDVERFSAAQKRIQRFDDGTINILFVGRLEPRKGVSALLKSIPLLDHYTRIPCRLIIVGSGLLSSYYRALVPRRAAHNVHFVGEVPFEDLPRFYHSADIFCSPATYGESFGIVLVEAMAAGVPVVAGNNDGYRRIIQHGMNGLLVKPGDPDDLARSIAKLVNSEQLRWRFSARGLEESKRYSWQRIIDRLEEIYIGLATRSGSSTAVSA